MRLVRVSGIRLTIGKPALAAACTAVAGCMASMTGGPLRMTGCLAHGIHQGVHVEHGHEGSVEPQQAAYLGLLVEQLAKDGRPPYGRILRAALPLAVADTLRSGLNTIEDLIIPRQLALFAGTVNAMADYGMIRGMVFPVLMFPAAVLVSLAELLIPEFSRCAAQGSRTRVQYFPPSPPGPPGRSPIPPSGPTAGR